MSEGWNQESYLQDEYHAYHDMRGGAAYDEEGYYTDDPYEAAGYEDEDYGDPYGELDEYDLIEDDFIDDDLGGDY